MKNLLKIIVTAVFFLLFTMAAMPQEWSKEQSEVWKVVEDGWAKWKAGDTDAMASMLHEKYQGWSDDSPLPMTKQKVIQWYKDMKNMMQINYYDIEPARIVITKNAAVVDYYFSYSGMFTMNDKKEAKEGEGKNVEFYIKEDGKWQLIGDMTVHGDDDGGDEDD
jgi:hypothetical protein